jgi:nitrogenase molybdenum-iron protein NifN
MRTAAAVRDPVRNPCKLCAPLGACLALRGVRGSIPLLHGSQGCSTYIRRYLIGHFREPCDIPASNFDEGAAVFGGEAILTRALANVTHQFAPELVGVATTCLSETIGDDVPALLRKAVAGMGPEAPATLHVSTPSYAGTHAEGFHRTVLELVVQNVRAAQRERGLVALLPGIVSPIDQRHLRGLVRACGMEPILVPDYGESWDGGVWDCWQPLPEGPTGLRELARLGGAEVVIALGGVLPRGRTAADIIASRADRDAQHLELPIGVRATDRFVAALGGDPQEGRPADLAAERSRLLDSYVDSHKLVAGRRVGLWGEVDLVVALAGFCYEIGLVPVVCASGAEAGDLVQRVATLRPVGTQGPRVLPDSDFVTIEAACREEQVDLLVGNSKGYPMARTLGRPFVRVGFPVHDRLHGARLRLLGYPGTQELLDRISDVLIGAEQAASPVGYMNY